MCDVVANSTVTGVNVSQLVGSENGDVYVFTLNWQSLLSELFQSLPGIKKIHHFQFCADQPGVVLYKICPDDSKQLFDLRSQKAVFDGTMPGLPLNRQWYLYNQICQYAAADAQDTVYPKQRSERLADQMLAEEEADPSEKAAKHKRK